MHINQAIQMNRVNRAVEETQTGAAAFFQEVRDCAAAGVSQSSEQYTHTQGVSASGSIDMSKATYMRPGQEEKESKTVADMLQEDSGMSAEARRNQMAVLANTLSAQDLQKAQEEGYSLSDMDSRQVVTVTDKIKAALAKAGVDISGYGDSLSREQLEEITGSAALAAQISNQLAARDLPVTTENVEDVREAYSQASSLKALDDGAMRYMLRNGLAPSIENIYLAEHSGLEQSELSPEAYASGKSDISEEAFHQLRGQVEKIITSAGLSVEEGTISDSRWILEQGLSLNVENLSYMQQLQDLSGQLATGMDEEALIGAMAQAISEGGRPGDGMLIPGYSMLARAEAAKAVIDGATEEDLAYVVDQGQELTVLNLKQAQQNRDRKPVAEAGEQTASFHVSATENSSGTKLALLTARRQLEEARLAMTTEANYALLKKGIQIDTKPLEALVEDLKNQEEAFAREMLSDGKVQAADEKAALFTATTNYISDLKGYPANILGSPDGGETIASLHEAGEALQNQYAKAKKSYETLMTAPRADMGDSIRKAFRNVEDILRDMDLEVTEENRRAVRILAYNETALTEENIQRIKAKDEEVQRLFKNMTPQTVLEMIRRDVNPLDMEISQVNRLAEQLQGETANQEMEQYSKYLYKLEQKKEITEEERTSYIGIYRLFAQIQRTDGAVIGALVNQGADLTLRNLLTAVRSGKKENLEYSVDDDFGGVQGRAKGPRIDDQIMAAYQTNLAKDIGEMITPSAFSKVREENWEDMTVEQFKRALEQSMAEENSDAAVEDARLEEAYQQDCLSRYGEVLQASEDVYRFLEQGDFQNSAQNVLAASILLQNPSAMFDTLLGKNKSLSERIQQVEDIKNIVLERFGEAIKTPEELAAAQEELADIAEKAMRGMIVENQNISVRDLRELRLMNQQFFLCRQQAREENYVVPMETGEGVTGVSLKIIRGREKKGFVDIMFRGQLMGKVAASFEAKEEGISGMIATDREQTRQLLSDNLAAFADLMNENGSEPVDIRVAYIPELSLEHFSTQSDVRRKKAGKTDRMEQSPVQTTRLYHIAESFIKAVKTLDVGSFF